MDRDLSRVKWRKARRSSDNGGNCVEVGVWRKSSYSSANGGDCIEVAVIDKSHPNSRGTEDLFAEAPHKAGHDRLYVIRDSKNPDGPKLYFTPAEWEAFRLGVIDGEFDDLAEQAEAAARSRAE